MCEFCEEHVLKEEGCGYGIKPLSERCESEYNRDYYTGISTYIDKDRLKIFAVVDGENVKCLSAEKSIKINYCPMCGRKL